MGLALSLRPSSLKGLRAGGSQGKTEHSRTCEIHQAPLRTGSQEGAHANCVSSLQAQSLSFLLRSSPEQQASQLPAHLLL